MNRIILAILMLVALAAQGGEDKRKPKEVVMTGQEINGVDRGKLNLVDETAETFSTMKPLDKTRADWEKKANETAEEIAWW